MYADLNPIRVQLAQVPEESEFTSIKMRIAQRRARQSAQLKKSKGEAEQAARILCKAGLTDTGKKLSAKQKTLVNSGND